MPVRRTLLRESPALAAYVSRVGAEELNFRRFMIKEYKDHYYKEKTLITISSDGSVHCTNPDNAPTDEEREVIAAELVNVEFPTSVKASNIDSLRPLLRGTEWYELRDVEGDNGVIMVQERRDDEVRGGKNYFPWSYWSDGVWRPFEPGGALPFWRPQRDGTVPKRRVMIHEGAKTASCVDKMLREGKPHPWSDYLSDYEHWGMIGGALSPHRADYAVLRRQNAVEVVYVCDNDYEGKAALAKISKAYGRQLRGVQFGEQWPPKWDMADPIPTGMFDSVGVYTGPHIADIKVHATYATVSHQAEGAKKASYLLSPHFAEEWLHSLKPDVYIHRNFPDRIYTADEFNDLVAPFSDVKNVADLVKKDNAIKCPLIKYDPSKESGVYVAEDGQLFVNTHRAGPVRERQGDPAPWTEFLSQLVPVAGDCHQLSRWAATFIARPDLKMHYGVLLISDAQGVGKTTFGDVLAHLAGKFNTSTPTESTITDSHFNDWMAHKRLAVVNEIYAGKSAKAYNRLKNVITDPTIPIEKKFMQPYQIDNWLHVVACSNSVRALKLDNMDRRWLVPEVTEAVKPKNYWKQLYKWLNEEGGYGIVKWWAGQFLQTNEPVVPGEPAPWTKRKQDVIEEGYSQGQQLVLNFIRYCKERGPDDAWLAQRSRPERLNGAGQIVGAMVYDVDLVEMIKEQVHQGRQSDYLERPLTVRKVAKAEGCYVHPENFAYKNTTHARLVVISPALIEVAQTMDKGQLVQLMRERASPLGSDALREWNFSSP